MGAGQILVMDQIDEASDNSGVFNSARTDQGFRQTGESDPPGRHDTADGGSPNGIRSQMQFFKVVSVDDSTHVTVTPPVYMPNWQSARNPEVWWWGNAASTAQFNGIEDLSVDNVGCGAGCQYNIEISNAYNNWVKNVRSLHSERGFVGLVQSARNEIRDCYFYGSPGAAVSYGIDHFASGDTLSINNISQHNATPLQGPSQGDINAYNFFFDMYFDPGTFNFLAIFASHDSGGGMALYEGNQTNGWITDVPHGNSPLMTVFRNHFKGRDDVPRDQNEICIELKPYGRAHNIIGNVLGLTGFHDNYETYTGGPGATGKDIYSIGYGGFGVANDTLVRSSLLRWGNWDAVSAAVRWCGNSSNTGWVAVCASTSEIPTTGITFVNGNPVPSTETLPNSFFLSSRPSAWWKVGGITPKWPPIGPDVTGGSMPNAGGHADKIPARLCFESLAADTSYPVDQSGFRPKIYNANLCYSAADDGAPTPPIGPPARLRRLVGLLTSMLLMVRA
jgi:hypothetical protein